MKISWKSQRGFTLIEALIGLGIFSIVSTSVYLGYTNVIEIIQASQYNSAAVSILESRIESVRNMRYEDVGVIGGIPAGTLAPVATTSLGSTEFQVHAYVRTIDDPFDGTIDGTPKDSSPNDYKKVQFEVTCETCTRYKVVSLTTLVAPKNLETSSKRGALFIHVQDAQGFPVAGATVRITNSRVSPAVDVTDTTTTSGTLEFFDVATSSAGYHVVVSKNGYSSEQTHSPSQIANPIHPDATVATQQLTNLSLSIDRISSLTFTSHDNVCAPIGDYHTNVTGLKLLGTAPDVAKYSKAYTTGVDGTYVDSNLEWDTYAFTPIDGQWATIGALSVPPLVVEPATTASYAVTVEPLQQHALSISVTDDEGTPLGSSVVTLSGVGNSQQRITGETSLTYTQWPAETISDTSPEIDTSTLGTLTLQKHGEVYASASDIALTSTTIDLGTSSISLNRLAYNATTPTAETTVRFQLATANDPVGPWEYSGPDGTSATYFSQNNLTIPATLSSKRYLRYKIILRTDDESQAPALNDLTIVFRSGCVPAHATLFNGLSTGTATIEVSRPGYITSTTSLQVTSGFTSQTVQLIRQ